MIADKKLISASSSETVDTGVAFGKLLKPGDVVCLYGNLGAGKTQFTKGIAQAMGINQEEVQSPTFAIIHEYAADVPLYHLDCYRLESAEEAMNIGIEEYLFGQGVCVIEWPEVIESLLPDHVRSVIIEHEEKEKRRITIHQKA